MPDTSLHTTLLLGFLNRIQSGDSLARDELLRATCGRLEQMAAKMLRGFPAVARWEQADDVLQNALMRLLRALEEVRPTSVREFFGLAAMQMRRELLDLARHYLGPQGAAAHHASWPPRAGSSNTKSEFAPPDRVESVEDLEQWCAFHEAVEALPAEQREVISLVFYHGWTQADIAVLFQVSERTVRRYWRNACLTMTSALGGKLPQA